MADVKEQRICIKFCFKLGKMAVETHKMLKEAFDDNALDLIQTYEWFKCFKNVQMPVDNDKHSGLPLTGTTTKNVAKVPEAILEDQRQTIHDVCDIVKLLYGTCQRILSHELNMWPRVTPCAAVFDFKEKDSHPTLSLFTRPRLL
jgi:hypothetical protein